MNNTVISLLQSDGTQLGLVLITLIAQDMNNREEERGGSVIISQGRPRRSLVWITRDGIKHMMNYQHTSRYIETKPS